LLSQKKSNLSDIYPHFSVSKTFPLISFLQRPIP
jgi:hypothetical protein